MITFLTPHSLQYKPMSIILWTTSLTIQSWCLKGMISLLPICISTVSGLISWRVGWIKWYKRLMSTPRKTLKYTLPFTFPLKCLLFSLPIWLSPIISIFWIFLAVSACVWSPGKILFFYFWCNHHLFWYSFP